MKFVLSRRSVLMSAGVALATTGAIPTACAQSAPIYDMHVSRDAGCGCCHAWTALMQRTGRFRTQLENVADMPALKRRLGVPADLASCHTAQVGGLVIEGHVPAEEVLRLLEMRPAGERGLAVPGMPLGSPGMETPSGAREPYDIVAFRSDGERYVFARRPGA